MLTICHSLAFMEVNLILTRMIWSYDMELARDDVDWEPESSLHVMWSKPELRVLFHPKATS